MIQTSEIFENLGGFVIDITVKIGACLQALSIVRDRTATEAQDYENHIVGHQCGK